MESYLDTIKELSKQIDDLREDLKKQSEDKLQSLNKCNCGKYPSLKIYSHGVLQKIACYWICECKNSIGQYSSFSGAVERWNYYN